MCASDPYPCLFCTSIGPYTTVEHTVPAALGNDDSVLVGHVCDKCQNYLGKEVEAFAVREPPIGVSRAMLGIRGRNRKLPVAESYCTKDKGGILPSFHSVSDQGLTFGADEDGSTWVAIENSEMVRSIIDGSKSDFKFAMTPKHVSMLGRLLGKMALELLCESDPLSAREQRFDELRRFVRFGVQHELWVLGYKRVCSYRELADYEQNGQDTLVTITCYEYRMLDVGQDRLFAFMFGGDCWVICMNHFMPSEEAKKVLAEECFLPLWYSRQEWDKRPQSNSG